METAEGAIGYLVGEVNLGLSYMFIMMNLARHAVGVEGLSIAERAYQQAVAYAKQRVQGAYCWRGNTRTRGDCSSSGHTAHVAIDEGRISKRYVDWFMSMERHWTNHYDISNQLNVREIESCWIFLTPIVKGWCTEVGNQVASHRYSGFMEE